MYKLYSFLQLFSLLLISTNIFSQKIEGKISFYNDDSLPVYADVGISGTVFYTKTDSSGSFTLKYESSADTVDMVVFALGYCQIKIINIPNFVNALNQEIKLFNVPVKMDVSFQGISKTINRQNQRGNRKKFRKKNRKFKFEDVWIKTKTDGYWMRKTNKKYLYEIDYNDLK